MIVREGELEFDFVDIDDVERLDGRGRLLPDGFRLVDFVVEEQERILFIEVKDPSASKAPDAQRLRFIKELEEKGFIHNKLVPKARDSYTFLHLMARDDKPIIFVILIGSELLSISKALLANLKDKLLARIRCETEEPWKRHYIRDFVVITTEEWQNYFPQYPLKRECPD